MGEIPLLDLDLGRQLEILDRIDRQVLGPDRVAQHLTDDLVSLDHP